MRSRSCWACFLTLWLSLSACAQTNRFDLAFEHWGHFYAPLVDYRWWKAQGMAESGLNQQARSYCGAIGVMQLMPATAQGLYINPFDPEANIQGGIHYDAQMLRFWARAVNPQEQRDLAFASYNAGPGNVARAVKLCNGPPAWSSARPYLLKVTGAHSAETLNYVLHINRYYLQLLR